MIILISIIGALSILNLILAIKFYWPTHLVSLFTLLNYMLLAISSKNLDEDDLFMHATD